MHRRCAQPAGERDRFAPQRRAVRGISGDQPGPGCRRERDRPEQLGIVAPAVLPVRIGPRPVEYVLSVRVRLQIERHRGDQVAAVVAEYVLGPPAGGLASALGLMQRMQEGVREQRLVAGEPIPGGGLDAGQRVDHGEFDCGQGDRRRGKFGNNGNANIAVMKFAIAQLNQSVGDLSGNARQIRDAAERAHAAGARCVLTPELSICGYPPEDLVMRPSFLRACRAELESLAKSLPPIAVVAGFPARRRKQALQRRRIHRAWTHRGSPSQATSAQLHGVRRTTLLHPGRIGDGRDHRRHPARHSDLRRRLVSPGPRRGLRRPARRRWR